MSLKSHEARKLAMAGVAALAVLGGAASSAQAANLTQNYSCDYPLIGVQPLAIAINASIPATVPAGGSTGEFQIKATATASGNTPSGVNILGATTLEGTSQAKATLTAPGINGLNLKVPITIPKQSVPGTSANLVLKANGTTPDLSFETPGVGKITVDALSLNLTARDAQGKAVPLQQPGAKDSDNNPDTFDVPCTLAASSSNLLTNFTVTGVGTSASPAPASVQPAAPAAAPGTTAPTVINYGYDLKGTAALKTLVSGALPLTGSIGAKVSLPTGNFVGDLNLAPTSGNLQALGFLPVAAKVVIEPQGQVTGTLNKGVLNASLRAVIKLPSVTLLGVQLAGGANCRTRSVTTITLKSTDKFFYPLSGGTLAGSFGLPPLVGCGFLNGLVSPLASGSGNGLILGLTPNGK